MIGDPGELVAESPASPIDDAARRRLSEYWALYQVAKSPATVRAIRSDLGVYQAWCGNSGVAPAPIETGALLAFARDLINTGHKRSSIRRMMASVNWLHRALGLARPTKNDLFELGLSALFAEQVKEQPRAAAGPQQAAPLQFAELSDMLVALDARDDARSIRDAALLSLASDSLGRIAELAAVWYEDLETHRDGSHSVKLYAKGDRFKVGSDRFVDAETMARIARWKARSGQEHGPIFRAVYLLPRKARNARKDGVTLPERFSVRGLNAQEVRRILQRRTQQFGVTPRKGRFSGHSTRVGTAVDLGEAGYSVDAIQAAGGWKSPVMAAHYTQAKRASRNAVAQLRADERRAAAPAIAGTRRQRTHLPPSRRKASVDPDD